MDFNWFKNNFKLLLICFILVIISIFLINYKTNNNSNIQTNEKKNTIQLVNNYSRFYTIDSCVNKYITFLTQKSNNNIYKLLNVDYINKNNINIDNVLNYVDNLTGNYNFSSRKMYYEQLNENDFKYYIYGYLSQDLLDTTSQNVEKYYIVNLYTSKMLFDITPYDGKIFKEET